MEFKPWYYLQEVIDTKDEKIIQNNLARIYDPETIEKINVYLDKYRNDPKRFPIKDIMPTVIRDFPPVDDKTQKLDNMVRDYQRRTEVTPEEVETLKYFFDQDVPSQSLNEMMNLLRDFLNRKLIDLKIISGKPELFKKDERGQTEKTNTPDFTRFISVLHGIQGYLAQLGPANNYYDPRRENDSANLVAKGDKIWVYKGSMPELCRKFGKGTIWCIASSSTTQHYYDYRLNYGQTQYFIYDFNKAEDDPARYVNPGVAPPGEKSEWVDFRNQHSEDPEEPNSQFGIKGYTSINDYKRYLASKGIDLSVFVADPIQDWELRLKKYVNSRDVNGAKNDVDSVKLWSSFLKLVEEITDDEFNSLTFDEKKMYVLKKWLTDYQREWAMTNFKQDYLKSIDDLEPIDEKTANFVLKNKKTLSSEHVYGIIKFSPDLSGIEERIGPVNLKKINQLDDDDISNLISHVKDTERVFDLLLNYKEELTPNNVIDILRFSQNLKIAVAKLEKFEKIKELDDDDISYLIHHAEDTEGLIYIVLNCKKELTPKNVYDILMFSKDVKAIEEEIGKENLKKINQLDDYDDNFYGLLKGARDLKGVIDVILNHKKEFTPDNVLQILKFSKNVKAIEEKLGEENLKKINQLDDYDDNFYGLLKGARDLKGVIDVILNHKKEFTPDNVLQILKFSKNVKAIEEKLGEENLKKIKLLNNDDIYVLMENARDLEGAIDVILNYKEELTPDNVLDILMFSQDVKAIEEKFGEENLKKINELFPFDIDSLMDYARDREGIRYILDKYRQK